ncbi:hypothetical protein Vretimale_5605 [Volvox reticuliferus]|nr:hypothetical protein Vretimale_5605 [Volvox reticuliferus]
MKIKSPLHAPGALEYVGAADRRMKINSATDVFVTPTTASSGGTATMVSGTIFAKPPDGPDSPKQSDSGSLVDAAQDNTMSGPKASHLQPANVLPPPPTPMQSISSFQNSTGMPSASADVEVDLNPPLLAAAARCLQHKEVKEVITKEEAKLDLNEIRTAKVTPEMPERQLPMPDDDEDRDDQAECFQGQEDDLVAAMIGLAVAPTPKAPIPLRGLPVPQGRHLRFDAVGRSIESPERTVLRGLPVATGKHTRFE